MTGCELKKCTSFKGGKCQYDGKTCKYNEIDSLHDGNIVSEVVNKIIETILLEFSAYLHVMPELPNGHEVGMVEVNYNDEGKLTYGPMWLSRNDTDKIVKQFIEYRNKK